MKISLKNARENEGIPFDEEIDPQDLDIDIGVMHFPEAILVKGEAWRSGNDLTVNAHLEAERSMTCSLCLEEKDFTLHYDIKGLDSVTLDPDIRDEIILEHPIRVLCKPDCRGLCAFCGASLNAGPCGCKDKT
jgi:uncharacterized protein